MTTLLLSEGSSLSARQAITALGPLGYRIDVCDSNPMCIGRFSRFVRHFTRCPVWAADPAAYLDFILARLGQAHYDVLLPVHEQAFLFAAARERLAARAGLALADFQSFLLLQSKAAFARLLDELRLPQPPTRFVHTRAELEALADFPFYVKAPYSTAGSGVWKVDDVPTRGAALDALDERGLLDGRTEIVVQGLASGAQGQAQAVFEHGRLIAAHCTTQLAEGIGGSQSARLSIDHPLVRAHLSILGERLRWHGALALDYLFEPASGQPCYIEANPRLVEPMNAALSGVNLADILVRLSLGETFAGKPIQLGHPGVRTHSLLATLLGTAARERSRRAVIGEASRMIGRQGAYQNSREDLTPLGTDPLSAVPLAVVGVQLLVDPARAAGISRQAISTYAMTQATVETIVAHEREWQSAG